MPDTTEIPQSRDVVRIHFLMEDVAGPIASGPGGVRETMPGLLGELNPGGQLVPRRLRFACHPTAAQSHFHRGSNEVQRAAGGRFVITCPQCLASEAFLTAVAAAEVADGPTAMFDAAGKQCC